MIGHLRRNLVAYVALLVALSGSAYAAGSTLLPANSVGTRQVVNHSLRRVDFKAGTLLRGPRGFRGAQGFTGAQGLAGPAGPPGATGIANLFGVVNHIALAAGEINFVIATCPAGMGAVSGGTTLTGADAEVFIDRGGANTWAAGGDNFDSLVGADLYAYVYCSTGVTHSGVVAGPSPQKLTADRIAEHLAQP